MSRQRARASFASADRDRCQLHRHLSSFRPLSSAASRHACLEAAGVVEAVGAGVKGFKAGDRIAYGNGPRGAYAHLRNVPPTGC